MAFILRKLYNICFKVEGGDGELGISFYSLCKDLKIVSQAENLKTESFYFLDFILGSEPLIPKPVPHCPESRS